MNVANKYIEDKELHINRKNFIDIVNSQNDNEAFYVGFCELGYCIKAKRNIKKGELIYIFKGDIIDFEKTKSMGERECMPIQFDIDMYIDTEAPGCLVNHSCDPNAGIKDNFNLIALENISIHEEIRFDYSTTMDENHYEMECKCGKPSCRKMVTDFKLLPASDRERYLDLNVVMHFIAEQYKQ